MPWRSEIYDEIAHLKARKDSKLEALYNVAAVAFKKHGFRGTSLSDIATALGITKAAIYNYVENKQTLAYELHMLSIEASEEAVSTAMSSGGDALAQLRKLIEIYVRQIIISPTASFLLIDEDALVDEHARKVAKRRKGIEKSVVKIIESGIKDGSIAPCDPLLATFVIVGAMQWVPRWFRSDGDWSEEQVAAAVSAVLGRGLAAEPYPIAQRTADR